jgi:xanthine dehydrogenase molybdopterin binding subunit/xanthine dehydrogenase small subunit
MGPSTTSKLQETANDHFRFVLNGREVEVRGERTHLTLLQWLRREGHTGTKEGCAEGDCGACTVLIVERNLAGAPTFRAINSCITLLPMVAGREVTTVEGLQSADGHAHPVQDCMTECYGSQCGYCTPGFVMSMTEAFHRDDISKDPNERMRQIGDQLNGNLCRCTGYRPIRDAAMRALAQRDAGKGPSLVQLRRATAKGSGTQDGGFEESAKQVGALTPVDVRGPDGTFARPTTLADLLEEKRNPQVELVCGATEVGVYINKKNAKYTRLVSTEGVAELRRIHEDARGLHIGGAASLTDLEDALGRRIPLLDKMLWVFASRQVRSRASVAGNLVTASPIGDLAPCLLVLDAVVVLGKYDRAEPEAVLKREVPIAEFFADYRKSVIAKDEVLLEVLVPAAMLHSALKRKWDSFKVSKRREMDISIVSAAFRVELSDDGVVREARLAFGGVAATPKRALAVEAMLVGRRWNDETFTAIAEAIEPHFTPLSDVRSGAPFRRGLLRSLWLKFALGVTSDAIDTPLVWQAPSNHTSMLADRNDPAGKALPHESGAIHVDGRARYVDDEASRRGMLRTWLVRSKVASGVLTSVDVSAARRLPGVRAIITATDIPGENDIGAVRKDEPLLAATEVCFIGQIIAVVVGDTIQACRDAAEAVMVVIEPKPPVLTLEEAIAQKSFHSAGHTITRGDVRSQLQAAPHRMQGTLDVGGQEHFYLESQAAWAEVYEDGQVFVSSSTQHPSEIQAVVSHVLHVPRSAVTVESPRMGGGFGGKETQGNAFAALAALASKMTGKPVGIQLDRDVDMESTGKRHPFRFVYDVGFQADGKLAALDVAVYNDGGYALDLSESICDRALFHIDNAYYIPALQAHGRVCKTNNVSHTAFRGFGGPQGMVCIEDILSRIAHTLGLSPEVVRERNFYVAPKDGDGRAIAGPAPADLSDAAREANTTHYGQWLEGNRIARVFAEVKERASFDARRAEITAFNANSPYVKRGLAVTPVKFGISFTATFLNQAGALVHIYRDGTVQVNHGGTEMGQGLYVKMQGVAMRELGLSAPMVKVTRTRTDKVPNTSATAASAGADLNGQAVKAACVTLRERLIDVASQVWPERFGQKALLFAFEGDTVYNAENRAQSVPFTELVERAYFAQVSLSTTGFYRTPGIGYDKSKGKGKPFYYFSYGAAVSEVEVDALSGMKRVRRVDIVHDVGDSLNRNVDMGQIEGAFVQGMGWLTAEELKWQNGRLLSHSASTYQIPAFGDAPAEFRVHLLTEATQPGVIHGSKAVGEPPLMLAISVREAIRDAVLQFAKEPKLDRSMISSKSVQTAPNGAASLPSPATHEAIFAAIWASV